MWLSWILCEPERVLDVIYGMWKGQIFKRDRVLQRGIGKPL